MTEIDKIPSRQNVIDIYNYLNKRIDDVNVSGLSADGTETGATLQAQTFQQGAILSNLTANSILVSSATKQIISGGTLTSNAALFPQVNATADGFDFADIGFSGAINVTAVATVALPASTYANGAAGVGATLTANANGAFPTVDGQANALNKEYLIMFFTGANRFKNGKYSLTTVGSAGTPWVLTRALDSNEPTDFTSATGQQIVFAAYTGGSHGRKYFIQGQNVTAVGTSPITYAANRGGTAVSGLSAVLGVSDDAGGLDITNLNSVALTTITDNGGDIFITNAVGQILIDALGIIGLESDAAINITSTADGITLSAVNPILLETQSDITLRSTVGGTIALDAQGGGNTNIINTGGTVSIGDTSAAVNSTEIRLNDTTKIIGLLTSAVDGVVILQGNHIRATNLQDFATNAAAVLGGLVAGDLFYTDVAGEATVKIVI